VKKIINLLAFSILSFNTYACPDLSGDWSCEARLDGSLIELTLGQVTENNGVTTYSYDEASGTSLSAVADGKARKSTTEEIKASCLKDKLELEFKSDVYGFEVHFSFAKTGVDKLEISNTVMKKNGVNAPSSSILDTLMCNRI
jgi:hypothetical protein